ncbi:hypothetical protein ACFSO7_03435 [Bacillus sp. CGMCC 1.16607]|uniref:hypothetical protein n=1 Tax=Bacillus sp. CGMCC 1.16607 TaxID=3351842 RepID=UPI00362EDB0B
MDRLLKAIEEIKTVVLSNQSKLESIEKRLSRLEKVDSIEHRVAVNQIDLSDIKEVLEGIKENFLIDGGSEIKNIHKRLDSHLIKLARAEEDIIILKTKS